MNKNVLNVWLYGEHLAEVEQLRNGKLRLRFTSDSTIAALETTRPITEISYLPELIRTRAHQLLTDATMQHIRVSAAPE